jgi:hypothetical protein
MTAPKWSVGFSGRPQLRDARWARTDAAEYVVIGYSTSVARRPSTAAVVASGRWVDPDGARLPAGSAHAWVVGTNQTLCGLSLHRSRLERFPHVTWAAAQPESGGAADRVQWVCPRCAAAMGAQRDQRPWTRVDPRP